MPKIHLKPNSAEFAEKQIKTKACDMPGCPSHGKHKAPKNRGLNDYYWFCMDHAREYNQAWDFFAGMSGREIEDHLISSLYGDRPTRRYDMDASAEDILRGKAWSTYNFSEESPDNKNGHGDRNGFGEDRNSLEFEALAIMGLEPPVTIEDIKIRYKELAKKHHPDLNKGCAKSEELLKRINMSYTILKLAYKQYEELPDKD